MGSALLGALGERGETPIRDPIGFGVGPIRGIGGEGGDPIVTLWGLLGLALLGALGERGEEWETPIWDPIGFGVGPIRGIVGGRGETPIQDPIGLWGRPY